MPVVLAGLSGLACAPDLDTTRRPADTGTFGQTVYTLSCQRIAYLSDLEDGGQADVAGDRYRRTCRDGEEPPPDGYSQIAALHAGRADLIFALDSLFPESFLPELQAYVTANDFLALYDDGTVDAAVDELVELFETLADDPDLAPALARLGGRFGYVRITEALGALHTVAAYPELDHLLLVFLDAITDGPAKGEFRRLQLALAKQLEDAQISDELDSPDRTLALAIDLLLSESPLLGTGRPVPIVVRDVRGLARVAEDPYSGQLAAPFVDADGDLLADAVNGQYVGADGEPLAAPPPFVTPFAEDTASARDVEGRALQFSSGPLLYHYLDLDRTVVAALVRDAPKLLSSDRGTALDALRGASALLGPRVEATHTYADGSSITFRGWDTSAAPLLDMLYGALLLLGDPGIDDTLSIARRLVLDHEAVAARLLEAIFTAVDLGDSFPEAALVPGAPLYDDLIAVVVQILEVPGLAEDLLRALEDPAVRPLGDRFRDYMKYRDRVDLDPVTGQVVITHPVTGQVTGGLSALVDRTAHDSGYNRSLMQRLLHVVADSNGAVACNKDGAVLHFYGLPVSLPYDECEMLRVENLAVFYVQSIAYLKDASGHVVYVDGRPVPKAELPLAMGWPYDSVVSDDMIESQSGIEGFRRHPTPEALNRVLLLDPAPEFLADMMDPAVCRDGDRFIDAHAGTLPVWELNGFFDGVRPIIQAFADHDAEQLFVDLLVVMHSHWPSRDSAQHQFSNPSGHGYARMSAISSYEPYIAAILESTDLWRALVDGAPTLNGLVSGSGRSAPRALADTARYLFTPQPGLASRLGATSTRTEDGRAVATLSPWYVLADAWNAKAARVVEAGAEGDAWESSIGELVDVLLRGDGAGGWHFRNPSSRGVTVALIDFLRGRIAAHRAAGDLLRWSRDELPARAAEILSGPLFAGAADFVLSLEASPEARAAIEDMGAYILDELLDESSFRTALVASADLVQLLLDDPDLVPIARVAGRALHPDVELLQRTLELLRGARHADATGTLSKLLAGALDEHAPGLTPTTILIDTITEVHREHPWLDWDRHLTADDYRSVLRTLARFFGDEKRGLRKFVDIVQERHIHD